LNTFVRMNLILDIGNTITKIAVFDGLDLVYKNSCKDEMVLELLQSLQVKFAGINACMVASVKNQEIAVFDFLAAEFNLLVFDDQTPLPIENHYGSPKTLGPDRLAAAVGAAGRFPNRNVLVIDAGTCITYEIVTDQNAYLGGAIAPGLDMRLKALNAFTSKLPLISFDQQYDTLIGNTTETCILSGVQKGVLFEMEGTILAYGAQFDSLQIVLTGGHHDFFVKQLKNPIFAAPDLVLEGLNIILNYNAST
jgi:type III pantothenate kinase